MTQLGLDFARIEGIERVSRNTDPEWGEAFDAALREVADRGEPFSVYEVLAICGKPTEVHPSAIGARIRAASNRGEIVKAGYAERASHGDVVTLWRASV